MAPKSYIDTGRLKIILLSEIRWSWSRSSSSEQEK